MGDAASASAHSSCALGVVLNMSCHHNLALLLQTPLYRRITIDQWSMNWWQLCSRARACMHLDIDGFMLALMLIPESSRARTDVSSLVIAGSCHWQSCAAESIQEELSSQNSVRANKSQVSALNSASFHLKLQAARVQGIRPADRYRLKTFLPIESLRPSSISAAVN